MRTVNSEKNEIERGSENGYVALMDIGKTMSNDIIRLERWLASLLSAQFIFGPLLLFHTCKI